MSRGVGVGVRFVGRSFLRVQKKRMAGLAADMRVAVELLRIRLIVARGVLFLVLE